MNNQTTYKRTKTNWWMSLPLVVIYVWIIFAYIFQWGNKPIPSVTWLVVFGIFFLSPLLLMWCSQLIISNNHIVFRMGIWNWKKIPITSVRNVSVNKSSFIKMSGSNIRGKATSAYFDFVEQTIIIFLRNGETYQIAIKNAQEIKDEIEKRMNK